ncbi:MAG: DUF4214 domain-containing protein [Rubrivivax sp.]|nr:DUF4214 domain-containing protein [Rubrivivax sp.]
MSNLDFLERLYARELGRPIDPAGLCRALRRLENGESLQSLQRELRFSDEAQMRAASLVVREEPASDVGADLGRLIATGPSALFVADSILLLMARQADRADIDAGLAALGAGMERLDWLRQLRRAALAVGAHSRLLDVHRLDPEVEGLAGARATMSQLMAVSDELFIELAYRTLFDRPPDARGRLAWLHRLRTGESRRLLLAEALLSPEGRLNQAQLEGIEPTWTLRATLALRRLLRGFGRWRRVTIPAFGVRRPTT